MPASPGNTQKSGSKASPAALFSSDEAERRHGNFKVWKKKNSMYPKSDMPPRRGYNKD